MKPLEVKPTHFTRLLLLGGQDVYVTEDVKQVNLLIANAEATRKDWIVFTGLDNTGPGAIRPGMIAGFMPMKIEIETKA